MLSFVFADRVVLGGGANGPLCVQSARLTVDGNRFAAVEPMTRQEFRATLQEERAEGVEVVDLGNALVSPAFINGHTHLSMAAYRGLGTGAMVGNIIEDIYYRVESKLTHDDVRAFARIGCYDSLLAGVGAVWDHYYHGTAVAEAMAEVGLAGVVAPTLQDLRGPGVSKMEQSLAETEAIAGNSSLAQAGILAAIGPHATDSVSDELWRRAHQAAVDWQLPMHMHVAQSIEEFQRSMDVHGVTPLARLARLGVLDDLPHALLVHCIYLTNADMELVDRQRHTLGFCPFSQMQFAFPANVGQWTHADLRWLAATDCGASNDTMNVQAELRAIAGLRMAFITPSREYHRFGAQGSESAAGALALHRQQSYRQLARLADSQFLLSRVWSVPGAMHPSLPMGVLAPGYFASLVVWDTEHPAMWPCTDIWRTLTMCEVTAAIRWMMVGGRWIGKRDNFHQSLLDVEYREALGEANRRLELLGVERW